MIGSRTGPRSRWRCPRPGRARRRFRVSRRAGIPSLPGLTGDGGAVRYSGSECPAGISPGCTAIISRIQERRDERIDRAWSGSGCPRRQVARCHRHRLLRARAAEPLDPASSLVKADLRRVEHGSVRYRECVRFSMARSSRADLDLVGVARSLSSPYVRDIGPQVMATLSGDSRAWRSNSRWTNGLSGSGTRIPGRVIAIADVSISR